MMVNGLPAHRVGDHWTVHYCGPSYHDSVLKSGSSNVVANNLAVGRTGDPVACGSYCANGSNNTTAN